MNGTPRSADDDPQTTAADKASDLADSINEAARGDDGQAGTADDHPLTATAIGDVVVVQNRETGGVINGLDVDDDSSERVLIETHAPVAGEVRLDGAVSGLGADGTPGASGAVTLVLGSSEYSVATQDGQSPADVLDDLRATLGSAGLQARVSRGRLRIVLPAGVRRIGFEADDATLDAWFSLTDV